MKKYIAEFVGTFALVFCGTGAIIINQQTGGQVSNVGIAITFGLIITAMIYTFGETSGAHFNPAVTLGFYAAGLFKAKEIFPFIASQVVGAFAASGLLKLLFPESLNLGTTLPAGSPMQSFILECVLGFFLMIVILFTSQGSKETGVMAGIAIGATILLEAMFAGPISGASMNPVRSLAPAIVSGNLTSLWVYLSAPIVGAIVATLAFRVIRGNKAEN
ncbi:MAG TPA: aquaporin [Bacteroidia bacterium]